MTDKTINPIQINALLESLNSAQRTCAKLSDAWWFSEEFTDDYLGDEHFSSVMNSELKEKMDEIIDLIEEIRGFSHDKFHKLEDRLQEMANSIGYEFKEIGAAITKKSS